MYGDTELNTEINHGQALHPRARYISLVVGINFIRLSIDRARARARARARVRVASSNRSLILIKLTRRTTVSRTCFRVAPRH